MGRNKKDYDDDFRMEVVRESLRKNAVDAEVAARYNISPSTLNEWKDAFFNNEIKSEAHKKLEKDYQKLQHEYNEALKTIGQKQLEVDFLKKKTSIKNLKKDGNL